MNRLGIFFFFDKDGVVDAYVPYYLKHLKPFCKELCVVVNKPLKPEGRRVLEKCCDKLLVRENIGFDSCAYKEAMESYGYEVLKQYDELILCNFTCYGPVYPFQEMFDKMAKSKADFWGISRHPKIDNVVLSPKQTTSYIPEHVMSYFMVIRRRMLVSEEFRLYWKSLETAQTYAEAVVVNELRFTDYFESRGFKSDVFISDKTYKKLKENGAVFNPIDFLKERCPLVKRRAFFTDYNAFIWHGRGNFPRETLEYIKQHTDYDVNLIWDNLLRTQPGSVLKRNLHLNYFLPDVYMGKDADDLGKKCRVAMICYIYYEDMVDYCLDYAKNLPPWADIYVVTVKESVAKEIKEKFSSLPNRLEVRLKQNRGKLASAILITCKDIFSNYDYVCVTQAKKTSHLKDTIASEAFCNHCWEGVLASPGYVLNVIQSFQDNPRMGYACSCTPHWGNFTALIGMELTVNSQKMQDVLHNQYHIYPPFDSEPVASYGDCYWVRGKAYKTLLSHTWKHEDFPEEPTPTDGTILHELERLNPIFVQYDGYYPAWCMPADMTSTYFDNMHFLYRRMRLASLNNTYSLDPGIEKDSKHLFSLKLRYLKYQVINFVTFNKVNSWNEKEENLHLRIKNAKTILRIK